MPVIKSSHSVAAASPFSMADIEAAARRTLLHAREQAERLLAEAQREAERLKADALTEGHAEGKAEGLRLGLEEGRRAGHEQAMTEACPQAAQWVQSLTAAMREIDASRRELEASAVAEVAELAVSIARRIIKVQCVDPKVLSANLSEALGLVVSMTDIRIQIHPTDKATLDEQIPRLKVQWPNLQHVEVVADDSVSPGGCRLATAQGRVDADLNTQLDRMIADLFSRQVESIGQTT